MNKGYLCLCCALFLSGAALAMTPEIAATIAGKVAGAEAAYAKLAGRRVYNIPKCLTSPLDECLTLFCRAPLNDAICRAASKAIRGTAQAVGQSVCQNTCDDDQKTCKKKSSATCDADQKTCKNTCDDDQKTCKSACVLDCGTDLICVMCKFTKDPKTCTKELSVCKSYTGNNQYACALTHVLMTNMSVKDVNKAAKCAEYVDTFKDTNKMLDCLLGTGASAPAPQPAPAPAALTK